MSKETTVTFRVEPELRAAFQQAADRAHRPAAQVLRELMRLFVSQAEKHTPRITESEKQRRQEAVNYATASVRLEGFVVDAAEEEHTRRFVNGDIDLATFVQAGLKQ